MMVWPEFDEELYRKIQREEAREEAREEVREEVEKEVREEYERRIGESEVRIKELEAQLAQLTNKK